MSHGRDIVGKRVLDALPESCEQPLFIDMLREVARTATPYTGQAVPAMIDRGDGTLERRAFEFIYHPLSDPSGAVVAIMVRAVERQGDGASTS